MIYFYLYWHIFYIFYNKTIISLWFFWLFHRFLY